MVGDFALFRPALYLIWWLQDLIGRDHRWFFHLADVIIGIAATLSFYLLLRRIVGFWPALAFAATLLIPPVEAYKYFVAWPALTGYSLALLLFMIPLMMWLVGRGTGAPPAVAALFLYSLLPIVRNTHAGIKGIPESLRESAEALGLPRWAILWRIELPLAAPTILAGIKTAAVINVGTATLGGFIGAGGYGRPILRGIDKFDVPLMLEGAIPAALMALAVEGLFDLAERMIARRT